MAKETKTNRESMRRLVRKDLGMKPYKMHKRQLLTTLNKKKRLERCKAMLSRFTHGRHNQILFPDEKVFTVQHILNKQNHRILATDKSTLPESTFEPLGLKNQHQSWYGPGESLRRYLTHSLVVGHIFKIISTKYPVLHGGSFNST